ncbi:DUF115 domain-containing protein [Paenibacillus sp. sptzw28]|uniref:motility associated factor glycosyltransferase family protein n=1 Tax=Paenibacillus sp. sptzw28 TaxID=715179 RepID=UPI001C6E8BBB|nr:6-hydroxymethylpterin diphosphokinase MptE-like protein [Paenibacillus sp. sptzw28]QYR19847.1 DUF115 domain-containing protein [Paenibacillus sp. sptzw28]
MLHFFDMEPLFRTRKFVFFVGDIPDFKKPFSELLSTPVLLYCTAPSVVYTPAARRMSEEGYLDIQRYIYDFMSIFFEIGNDHYDTVLGFRNIYENIDEVVENPYLSCLKDKFKNVPAFIIANGPSLDGNINELQKVKGKGLILCSESAILPLMRNRIHPDAICVKERTPASYERHFETMVYPEDISLIAFAVADPRIMPSFAGAKVPVFRNLDSNGSFFNRVVGDGSALDGFPSSAHLAFDAAVYMGANPIVLVGQDLAFGRDGAVHSRQSIYSDEKYKHVDEQLKSKPVVYMEGNDGKSIPSTLIFYRFKLRLEQMIRANPHLTVYNATEGGAKIEGTTCVKLADVVERYCKDSMPHKLHEWINENKKHIDIPEKKNKVKNLMAELERFSLIYSELNKMSLQRKEKCCRLLDLSEKHNFSEIQEDLEGTCQLNYIEMMKFLHPHLHIIFFQQVVMILGFHRLNELGTIDSPVKKLEAIKIQSEVFDRLSFICEDLVRLFRLALNKLSAKGYDLT